MPIYFNAASHLWIAYLFLVNGMLLHWLIRARSIGYQDLTRPFEAQILAAFFLSISVNGLILLILDLVDLPFSLGRAAIPLLTLILLALCIYTRRPHVHNSQALIGDISCWRCLLYLAVFVVLFYNGGLIEQVSDAWWHMSLANKIGLASSFTLENGHLNGVSSRYYPPLWHGNLALAHTVSDVSIPVLWNSLTAWAGVLKVMAFYLFALALGGSVRAATISAILFVLLPGVGDSYLRVSAWPSHIAYTALFCLFYTTFQLLDRLGSERCTVSLPELFSLARVHIACLVVLSMIVIFSHQLEIIWFATALLFYYLVVLVHNSFAGEQDKFTESGLWIFNTAGASGLILLLSFSTYFFLTQLGSSHSPDIYLAIGIFPMIGAIFTYVWFSSNIDSPISNQVLSRWLLALLAVIVLLTVDIQQFRSLFDAALAHTPRPANYAAITTGWFGHELLIPDWSRQLRFGLLYSGVVSIPVAIALAIHRPSRLTLFTAATATFALLFCLSPYLYQGLTDLLQYHSAWRVSILIFHPIIFAALIEMFWNQVRDAEPTQ
ncbi:MAG: hypothetical protein KJP04_04155 [Arenicella sp.]|nr:hypothetical protein [Arenicella sp.]